MVPALLRRSDVGGTSDLLRPLSQRQLLTHYGHDSFDTRNRVLGWH